MTKNNKQISDEEITNLFKDKELKRKIWYTIKQKSKFFDKDEINNIITDGMLKGINYFEHGHKKTIHTNIVQFIVYTIINAHRDKKVRLRREERIKAAYIENKSFEYTTKDIDFFLDLESMPQTEQNIILAILSGYNHNEIKGLLNINNKQLKSSLLAIKECILNR